MLSVTTSPAFGDFAVSPTSPSLGGDLFRVPSFHRSHPPHTDRPQLRSAQRRRTLSVCSKGRRSGSHLFPTCREVLSERSVEMYRLRSPVFRRTKCAKQLVLGSWWKTNGMSFRVWYFSMLFFHEMVDWRSEKLVVCVFFRRIFPDPRC